MDALQALTGRQSISPAFLVEPAPAGAALAQILAAGAAAPDHGQLRPWRFLVIAGAARVRLGEVFAEALVKRQPEASEALREQERKRPLRAPLIIAVIATVAPEHPKIPALEQLSSAAAAAQNMLLAAHALGFGGKWVTGTNAYDAHVRHALGLAPAHALIGFLHFGTIEGNAPTVPHAEATPLVEHWTGT